MAVLPPVNEVIDLHSVRSAISRRHLPMTGLVLLVTCAMIGVGTAGYGDGIAGGRHQPLTTVFALLIAATIWVIVDLDYPRHGLIRTDGEPLTALQLK